MALLVIFVVSTIAALFGAGKMLTAIFRAYVFKVETCDFKPMKYASIPAEKAVPQFEEPQKECKVDFNRAKEDVSNGLAMFIIAAPLAAIFFFRTKRFLNMS